GDAAETSGGPPPRRAGLHSGFDFFQVLTGAERTVAGPGEHHGPHGIVLSQLVVGRIELLGHFPIHRVARLGAIHHDDGNSSLARELDRHKGPPWMLQFARKTRIASPPPGRRSLPPCRRSRLPCRTHMEIGLTLPNRGVLLGATTPDQMLDLAE